MAEHLAPLGNALGLIPSMEKKGKEAKKKKKTKENWHESCLVLFVLINKCDMLIRVSVCPHHDHKVTVISTRC